MRLTGNPLSKLVDRHVGIPLVFTLGALVRLFPFQRFLRRDSQAVLLVKMSALGDTLLLLPVIRSIRRSHPGWRLVMVATRVNMPALEGCRDLDEVLEFDYGIFWRPLGFLRFMARLWRTRAVVALDFDQWLRISPLLCLLSGARKRIGFRTRGQYRHYLYTGVVERTGLRHEMDRFFDIAARIGVERTEGDRDIAFDPGEEASREAGRVLTGLGVGGKYAVVHPGCRGQGWQRRWPEKRYGEVVDHLAGAGYDVILSVGPGEEEIGQAVLKAARSAPKALPVQPVRVLAAVLKGAGVFVSGNTGIMHLAAAVGAPVVALHGAVDPGQWGPVSRRSVVVRSGVPCSPCVNLGFEYLCRARWCMEDISVADVTAAITRVEGMR